MENIYDNDDLFQPETTSEEKRSLSGTKPEEKRHPSMDESVYLTPDLSAANRPIRPPTDECLYMSPDLSESNKPLSLPAGLHPMAQDSPCLGSENKSDRTCQNDTVIRVLLGITTLCLVSALAGLAALGHDYMEKQSQIKQLKAQHENITTQLRNIKSRGCTPCADGWMYHDEKCYFFSFDSLNWTESRDECVAHGGHLVIINNLAEQTFLTTETKESHWIGLNDLEHEGQWVWVDNSQLTRASPQYWYERSYGKDEPDNWIVQDLLGEDCASLGDGDIPTNVWFDESCKKMKKYVCETLAVGQDRYNVRCK